MMDWNLSQLIFLFFLEKLGKVIHDAVNAIPIGFKSPISPSTSLYLSSFVFFCEKITYFGKILLFSFYPAFVYIFIIDLFLFVFLLTAVSLFCCLRMWFFFYLLSAVIHWYLIEFSCTQPLQKQIGFQWRLF